jgi:hypothetical protein
MIWDFQKKIIINAHTIADQEKKLGSPQPAQQYSVGFAFN